MITTFVQWVVERQKNYLSNKPDLKEHFIYLINNDPEIIKKSLLENFDYDIVTAIHFCSISADFKVDKNKKISLVEDTFNALKKEFVEE